MLENLLRHHGLALVVVLLGCVFPRLMLIGGLPATDEGYYAYSAMLVHHSLASGRGLPDEGTLMLYPMLLSWIFSFSANPFVLLRLADLLVASIAAWLLFRVLVCEGGNTVAGALIALVFIATMNQPSFIQFGFKNSMAAALVPLLLATRLGQEACPGERWRWTVAGGLAASAVLLRETFLPFAAFGMVTVLVAHGYKASLHFAIGALLTGLPVVLGIVVDRGGSHHLIDAYRSAGIAYASIADQRHALFLDNGWTSAKEASTALGFAALGIGSIIAARATGADAAISGRLAFWLGAALLPLLEPISKIGFSYHFAVCLPGLGGLSALGWKYRARIAPKLRFGLVAAAVFGGLLLVPKLIVMVELWPSARNVLRSTSTGRFPEHALTQSNYLLAAEAIRREAPANATLSVSGFMYGLYPLTGLLPPTPAMANLTTLLISLGQDGERFKQALLACPPDLLMTSTRTDWPGALALSNAVDASGIYRKVATVPVSDDRAYGNFGGDIYRRVTQASVCKTPRIDPRN